MRTTALPSMLEVLARNYNFNNANVRLFEVATVYIPTTPDKLPDENKVISFGMYGACDFYTAKGVCENILSLAQIKNFDIVATQENISYHPGRCAKILVGDKCIGIFGEIHPLTLKNYDINLPVYAAELDFDTIFALMDPNKVYSPLPKYPATTRDFSFVCDEALEVGTIFKEVKKAGGKLVEDISLFDIYRGPQVGENKKSVSIRVTLRASDRTLTVEEAEKSASKILKAMEQQLGISLRA